jgi:hypothetical protein
VRNYWVIQFYIVLIVGMMFWGTIQARSITRSQETSILYSGIHTFNQPGNHLIIDTLSFQESWYYELSFEVVSPHYCQTNVSMTDPEGHRYLLYSGTITGEPKNILFGASLSGAHSMDIEYRTTETLNVQVQVKSLGKISEILELSGKVIKTQTIRYLPTETRKEVSFMLERNDECIVDLFSTTPLQIHSSLSLNVSLEDPKEHVFCFYQGFMEENFSFEFQPNYMGIYSLITEIESLESPLNLMVVVSLHVENPDVTYSVPLEAQLYSGIILLTLLLIPYFIIRKLE